MTSSRVRIANFGLNLAGFLGVVNITVIYLALPYIERALHAGIADQAWIVSIYPLMEGGFTLAAGTLGDLYGRKRLLTITTWLFVIATLLCALAPNANVLIVMRALQGLGGAALLSLPVAVLIQMLPEEADHEDTIKVFSTVAGAGGIAGPIIGGILVHFWGWPSVFYFSVVMGIAVLVTISYATESQRDPSMRFDGLGQFLSILALVAVSFALIEGNTQGWRSPIIIAAFTVFAVGLGLFIAVERRIPKPMVHLRYFSSRAFVVGLLMVGINNFLFYGILLLCTALLQNVQQISPVAAGFYLMPANLAFFMVNQYSEQFEKMLGERLLIFAAWVFLIVGILWLAILGREAPAWEVAAGLFVLGIGFGLIWTPACAFSMEACNAEDQGFASGAIALTRSFFGVLGIAILGSLLAAAMARSIGAELDDVNASAAVQQTVTAAVQHGGAFALAQRGIDGISQSMLMRIVEQSFTRGWHIAMLFAGAFTLLVGIVVYIFIPERKPEPADAAVSS
ncbi:MAG TPA: MFS transporter [Candidatus Baltobacteraceae bacterium]|nr:MFS transporter [Candidatus Baltobacteraceae bacterium]